MVDEALVDDDALNVELAGGWTTTSREPGSGTRIWLFSAPELLPPAGSSPPCGAGSTGIKIIEKGVGLELETEAETAAGNIFF